MTPRTHHSLLRVDHDPATVYDDAETIGESDGTPRWLCHDCAEACDDARCTRHGDALFCHTCRRWVTDERATCPAIKRAEDEDEAEAHARAQAWEDEQV